MKSRTRLSRSRSIRDAVELISIEWNDGNENTERERERRAYTDSIPKRARQRSLSSFEGARMRARSSDSYQRRATCRIPLASWPEAAASLSEEREGEGRRGARAEADSRKKDSLSRKYERGLFVSSSSSSYENVSA